MKKLILFLLISTFSLTSKEVVLKVNHLLNGEKIILEDQVYQFHINEIKFSNIMYYMMNIELIDNNGNSIICPEKYHLIDAHKSEYQLGNVNIENINSIKFNIGVDKETNHSDPSLWPNDHPLSLEYSIMHWGWAAGYRFVLLDGFVNDIFNRWLNGFQYHLVGNQYFSTVSLNNVQPTITENQIIIELNVELALVLDNVNVASNNFIHGSGGANDVIANNIKNKNVFQSAISSVKNLYPDLKIAPIPATDFISLELGNTNLQNLTFKVFNLNGKFISDFTPILSNSLDISNLTKGTYFLNVYKNQELVKNIKFIKI